MVGFAFKFWRYDKEPYQPKRAALFPFPKSLWLICNSRCVIFECLQLVQESSVRNNQNFEVGGVENTSNVFFSLSEGPMKRISLSALLVLLKPSAKPSATAPIEISCAYFKWTGEPECWRPIARTVDDRSQSGCQDSRRLVYR